jgi:hypothetical protein
MKRTTKPELHANQVDGTPEKIEKTALLDRLMRELVRARDVSRDALRRVRTDASQQALEDFLKARQTMLVQRRKLLRALEAHHES